MHAQKKVKEMMTLLRKKSLIMMSAAVERGKKGQHVKLVLRGRRVSLLWKRKYHCTADLLFDQFGFDRTSKSVVNDT